VLRNSIAWLVVVIVMLLVTSCAAPIQKYLHSIPPSQTVSNEYFYAEISPFISYNPPIASFFHTFDTSYVIFEFSLKNKCDKDIEIDWNRTLYISQGKTSGGFMFEGIAYLTRNNPKPPDIVFANSSILKQIFPNILVEFNGRNWIHSPMSSGENGVYLSVIIDGKEITEKLLVNISYETAEQKKRRQELEALKKKAKELEEKMNSLESQKKDMENRRKEIERLGKDWE